MKFKQTGKQVCILDTICSVEEKTGKMDSVVGMCLHITTSKKFDSEKFLEEEPLIGPDGLEAGPASSRF